MVFGDGCARTLVFLMITVRLKQWYATAKLLTVVGGVLLNDRGQCCHQHIKVLRFVVCVRCLSQSLRLKCFPSYLYLMSTPGLTGGSSLSIAARYKNNIGAKTNHSFSLHVIGNSSESMFWWNTQSGILSCIA